MRLDEVSFDLAKKTVEEKVLRRIFRYMEGNPERNLLRILAMARLLAIQEDHKRNAEKIAKTYRQNQAVRSFINRLFTETHPNVKRRLVYNWFVNAMILGIPRQQAMSKKLGVNVPNFFLVDPTSACNLACAGCWAGRYAGKDSLPLDTLDRIFSEAKDMGIYWVAMSGGEPLAYPHLFELLNKHRDMAFMAYTNGTLIDEEVADKIVAAGNFSPAFSLEGWEDRTDARRGRGVFGRVMKSMDLLRERGAIFGVSITITRHNCLEVTSDEFIDFLIGKGVAYGWNFHYIPIGRNPDVELMVTPEQRAYLAERIPYIRTYKPIMIADFWNDGEFTQGCIAGGRRYFHINAAGYVEPCAFVHFATHNIKECSLLDVLRSPFFAAYQKRQPFCDNHLRPCPIIDVPIALREIVAETGARPTHPGAETVLSGGIAEFLDRRAENWAVVGDGVWEERKGGCRLQSACR